MTTTAVRHGYTPAQAVQLAEAAVKLSGGKPVPAWVRDLTNKVAHGELSGDEAVAQIKARMLQESQR
ncbi:antitoxin VbhA family protein [Mycobacteroides salmoniphilum]|uniref:antitoxin VbhA family protein n=1 Tax=Mycobacteroides salmoniphilum TaxID=404941 RepID=UPI003565AE4A